MPKFIDAKKLIEQFQNEDADVIADYGCDYGAEFGYSLKKVIEIINAAPAADMELKSSERTNR